MQADPEYLRRHYASLSDEALLEIDRADLVGAAQQCYDAEVGQRSLTRRARKPEPEPEEPYGEEPAEQARVPSRSDGPAEWLDEATEVYSVVDTAHGVGATDAATRARDILERAGIPCHLESVDLPEEKDPYPPAKSRWRLVVPHHLGFQAISTLERDIDNREFETVWRAHLEGLSDGDLLEMAPEAVFCGLFDRIERITRAYDREIARRGLEE